MNPPKLPSVPCEPVCSEGDWMLSWCTLWLRYWAIRSAAGTGEPCKVLDTEHLIPVWQDGEDQMQSATTARLGPYNNSCTPGATAQGAATHRIATVPPYMRAGG